jgi:hypothetical protein
LPIAVAARARARGGAAPCGNAGEAAIKT